MKKRPIKEDSGGDDLTSNQFSYNLNKSNNVSRRSIENGLKIPKRKAGLSNYPFIVYNFRNNDVTPIYHDLIEFHQIIPSNCDGEVEIFTNQFGIYLIGGLSKFWYHSQGVYDLPAMESSDYRVMVINWCDMSDGSIYNFCLFLPVSIVMKLPTFAKIEPAILRIIERYTQHYQLNRLNPLLFQEIKRSFLGVVATNFIASSF